MRINRFLALATGMSRRAADAALAEGRVSVDGRPAAIGQQITQGQMVELDGKEVTAPEELRYAVFNKPPGYVTSRVRQGEDPTMYDLLPEDLHALKPVGRLDRDSCGLLLLTNDGELAQALSHPSGGKIKRYALILNKPLKPQDAAALEQGVPLEDGPSHMRVIVQKGARVTVELGEGRNRQIRRTMGALGYGIVELKRLAMGRLELEELEPGDWQMIKREDIV